VCPPLLEDDGDERKVVDDDLAFKLG